MCHVLLQLSLLAHVAAIQSRLNILIEESLVAEVKNDISYSGQQIVHIACHESRPTILSAQTMIKLSPDFRNFHFESKLLNLISVQVVRVDHSKAHKKLPLQHPSAPCRGFCRADCRS
jgi:hypothetical protein